MQPLRRLLNSRRASIVATQKRNNPAALWFSRGAQWSLTIGEMLAPNINVLTSVRTAAAAVSQEQQSACRQKGTPEFFQVENPPLFVDASVRYTESRLDHWFLANDRRYICNLRSGVFFVLLLYFFGSRGEKNNAWYIHITSREPPPNLHNPTFPWPVMLFDNKRLPYGNQILARIMSLLKSILGKRKFLSTSMFRWRFLKRILNVFKYC